LLAAAQPSSTYFHIRLRCLLAAASFYFEYETTEYMGIGNWSFSRVALKASRALPPEPFTAS